MRLLAPRQLLELRAHALRDLLEPPLHALFQLAESALQPLLGVRGPCGRRLLVVRKRLLEPRDLGPEQELPDRVEF